MKRAVLLMILLLGALTGYAQRTANKNLFLDFASGYPVSAKVGMGQYLLHSYWAADVDAIYHSMPLSTGDVLHFAPIVARGSYMYRICNTRSRSLNFYGGGSFFLGCEVIDPFNRLRESVQLPTDTRTAFVIGFSADLSLEVYPFPGVGFVLGGRIPVTFLSQVAKMSNTGVLSGAEGTLGVRINL